MEMLKLIAYFITIMVLIYLYIIFLAFLGKSVLFIIKTAQNWWKEKKVITDGLKVEYIQLISKNPFLLKTKKYCYYIMLFFIGNIIVWQYFRYTWVYGEYQHKKAMEYHSLSHMLLSYEMGLLIIFRSPNSIILAPLNLLQDSLIDSAKKHLPENDGEIAMFNYFFKLYPYMMMYYTPAPSEAKEVAALTYNVLKDFSTKSIADKKVREYRRYRLYPMAAEYFIFIQWDEYGEYTIVAKKNDLKRIALFNDKLKLKQLEDIGRWSLKHYEEHKNYPKIKAFIKENPLMEAMFLNDIVAPLREVIQSKIFHLTFRCEDALIPLIYKYVNIYSTKYPGSYMKHDKRFRKYNNIIKDKSRDFSNALCALCGHEPIKGTYMHYNTKGDACYPLEYYRYGSEFDRNTGFKTQPKWYWRVSELEKKILKTNFRAQIDKCYKDEWRHINGTKEAKMVEAKEEFTECLIDNKLIKPEREKFLKCYSPEFMGFMKLPLSTEPYGYDLIIQKFDEEYKACLIKHSLINLEEKE